MYLKVSSYLQVWVGIFEIKDTEEIFWEADFMFFWFDGLSVFLMNHFVFILEEYRAISCYTITQF